MIVAEYTTHHAGQLFHFFTLGPSDGRPDQEIYWKHFFFLNKVDNKFIAATQTGYDKLQLANGDKLQQNWFQICTFLPS